MIGYRHHRTWPDLNTTHVEKETMAVALVCKPNVTSPLWEHFGIQPNEKEEPANLNEANCKICGKMVQVKRGNTMNLRALLASYHPAIETRLLPPPATQSRGAAHASASRQLGVGEAFARVAKYSRDSDRHKRLTGTVTRYLVNMLVFLARNKDMTELWIVVLLVCVCVCVNVKL